MEDDADVDAVAVSLSDPVDDLVVVAVVLLAFESDDEDLAVAGGEHEDELLDVACEDFC